MEWNTIITFIITGLTALFFIWGKLRSDIVALCSLLLLMFFQILTTEQALSGFSNPIVVMMVSLFIVGGAIFQTGLAKMISSKMLSIAGKSQLKLFLLVMLVTGSIGSFISNTGTVAVMLPIIISLSSVANADPRRFLMPMAFASSMGGMLTLIGPPPNLIISDTLIQGGFEGLSFFSFLPVGAVCLGLGTVLLWPLSKLLISDEKKSQSEKNTDKSLKELAHEYQLIDNLYRVKVEENSAFVDKQLKELTITNRYNITVVEIRRTHSSQNRFRRHSAQLMAGPESTIRRNDILYLFGSFESVKALASENRLQVLDSQQDEGASSLSSTKKNGLLFSEIGIAELVVLSTSNSINKTAKESDFRNRYNINILGIRRQNHYLLQHLGKEKIHSGDLLLVQGKWNDIEKLNNESSDWVVVGQPMEKAAKVALGHKAPHAAVILTLMVIAMVFNILPPVTATMLAAMSMIITGCFRNVEAAYKTINWESIFLFAGMIPISIAMEVTGGSAIISSAFVDGLGQYGPSMVLAGIYLGTAFLTMFISNTATAVLFAPIALQAANSLGISPYPFLFAVAVAASMCFASPFSTPPNALVMSAGGYSFKDYVKVGLPLQLIFAIVMTVLLPLIFPF